MAMGKMTSARKHPKTAMANSIIARAEAIWDHYLNEQKGRRS
jgi:hypothetical protein